MAQRVSWRDESTLLTQSCGPHVLIIDSDDDNRDLYGESLEWLGCRVTLASSAEEAAELICIDPPDAVVSSLRLEGMDGFDLCRLLGSNARTARIPVIAFSTCWPTHVRALHMGRFAAVLLKPCLPETLYDVVRAAIAGRRAHHGPWESATNMPSLVRAATVCSSRPPVAPPAAHPMRSL